MGRGYFTSRYQDGVGAKEQACGFEVWETRSLIGRGPIEGSRIAARNRRPRGPEYAVRERDFMRSFENLPC